jgi:preprotein translocase subunit SecF
MDWLKYKKYYFFLSTILIVLCIYGLANWGLRFGVDFRGGTLLEYATEEQVSTEELGREITEAGLEVSGIQTTAEHTLLIRMAPIDQEQKEVVEEVLNNMAGGYEELRFETIGPAVGAELVTKTFYAIAFAAVGILLWIAIQFKNIKFGISAVIATLHDSFILIGSFAFFGHLFGAEVDFLVVTAALTTLSFSVHDTIVVYDRIRENSPKYGDFTETANRSVSETMVRSLNNSFTLLFMLVAIILLGGTTIRWFAVALFVGTVVGTYSSPFVAVPILATWEGAKEKMGFGVSWFKKSFKRFKK